MSSNKVYDYYYSKNIENNDKEAGKHPNHIFINGKWYVYTEAIEHGHTPIYKDQIFVGSAIDTLANYRIRQEIPERSWRKKIIREEKKCDGYCQLCITSSCYTERIVDV